MQKKNGTQKILEEIKGLREEVRALRKKVREVRKEHSRPNFATEHPHIIRVENVQGGDPIVRGKSVTVQTIVALYRQNQSPQQIVDDYDGVLTLAEVYDALSYYYDHPGEIEQYSAENRAALEKA